MEILVPPADFGLKINLIACHPPVLPENCVPVTVNHMTRSVPAVAPTANTLLTMHNLKKKPEGKILKFRLNKDFVYVMNNYPMLWT